MELLARNIDVFKQYLDAGADVNAMGGLFEWTLLHEAANLSVERKSSNYSSPKVRMWILELLMAKHH